MVDISGLDRVVLLRALWDNQARATYFHAYGQQAPEFDEAEARVAVSRGQLDYFAGRAMKFSFPVDGTNLIDPEGYDRVAGKGTMARVVAQLRKGGVAPAPTEDRLYCETDKPQTFAPFGQPMLPGVDGTTMCAHCGNLKRGHEVRK